MNIRCKRLSINGKEGEYYFPFRLNDTLTIFIVGGKKIILEHKGDEIIISGDIEPEERP